MAKYYLLDTGKNMTHIAKLIDDQLTAQGSHVVKYLTDVDGLLCVEEISEDEFLDHYSTEKTKKK